MNAPASCVRFTVGINVEGWYSISLETLGDFDIVSKIFDPVETVDPFGEQNATSPHKHRDDDVRNDDCVRHLLCLSGQGSDEFDHNLGRGGHHSRTLLGRSSQVRYPYARRQNRV